MIYSAKNEQLPAFNYSLVGYLHSWKYFHHVEDQLRLDLTFKTTVLDRAKRFIEIVTPIAWRGRDFVKVVIHVRRGDLSFPSYRRQGWSEPEPDYFNRSMAYYCACHPRVLFVVLSNDMRWCRRNVVGDHVVYSTGKTPIEDMAIASLCDHAITTVGSFSWWAGWFTGGVVVTQKNFPTPRSNLSRRINRQDYYKPEQISL